MDHRLLADESPITSDTEYGDGQSISSDDGELSHTLEVGSLSHPDSKSVCTDSLRSPST